MHFIHLCIYCGGLLEKRFKIGGLLCTLLTMICNTILFMYLWFEK